LPTERMIPRSNFIRGGAVDPDIVHEVILAVKQNNLDVLEMEIISRATPGSANYLQWLTFDQIGQYIANPEGTEAVTKWVQGNPGLTMTWTSPRGEYIKASGSIGLWNYLLNTTFYTWTDESLPRNEHDGPATTSKSYRLAEEYYMPAELDTSRHVTAIFNTVQTPPLFKQKYLRKNSDNRAYKTQLRLSMNPQATSSSNSVTVAFLKSYYKGTTKKHKN
jgi:Pro-kumamolisin, activation domain